MDAPQQQTVADIIKATGEAISNVATQPVIPEASIQWWQIFATVGGTIAAVLTAWASVAAIRRKKKS